MLIRSEDIRSRFRRNLEWATEVDLATAWATNNAGLRDLRERQLTRGDFEDRGPLSVRSIVGLYGNITEPEALRALVEIGNLRIVDERRLFHPKIYIFRNRKNAVAWIGSANFTSGGFGGNEELMFETKGTRLIRKWFENRWKQCDEFQHEAIDDYEQRRKENPNPMPRFPKPERVDHPYEWLNTVNDWNEYRCALNKCNDWWAYRNRNKAAEDNFTVFGETNSWYNTILELRDVVRRPLAELDEHDQRRLLGLAGVGTDLLGHMRPRSFNTIFQDNLQLIQEYITRIINAADNQFPGVAIGTYEQIKGINGIGPGIATRLMALARPDHVVSLNSASKTGLMEYFEIEGDPGNPAKYGRILQALHEKPWFQTPEPENSYERSIWSMRAALIDCFVYRFKKPR